MKLSSVEIDSSVRINGCKRLNIADAIHGFVAKDTVWVNVDRERTNSSEFDGGWLLSKKVFRINVRDLNDPTFCPS